jgi:hypothetical protein
MVRRRSTSRQGRNKESERPKFGGCYFRLVERSVGGLLISNHFLKFLFRNFIYIMVIDAPTTDRSMERSF